MWWFLPYKNVMSHNYLYIDMHPFPFESPSPFPSHTSRLSQDARLCSLCHVAASHQLSVLHMIEYICQCYFFNWSFPLLPSLYPHVCSLRLHLHFLPASLFISNIFSRFHIYTLIYYTSFSVFYLLHSVLTSPGFPGGSDGKASAYNAGDPGLIPGSGRSSGEVNGNPLQYSCLENPMDGGAWQAIIHGVTKSRTRLSNFISLCTVGPRFIHLIETDIALQLLKD